MFANGQFECNFWFDWFSIQLCFERRKYTANWKQTNYCRQLTVAIAWALKYKFFIGGVQRHKLLSISSLTRIIFFLSMKFTFFVGNFIPLSVCSRCTHKQKFYFIANTTPFKISNHKKIKWNGKISDVKIGAWYHSDVSFFHASNFIILFMSIGIQLMCKRVYFFFFSTRAQWKYRRFESSGDERVERTSFYFAFRWGKSSSRFKWLETIFESTRLPQLIHRNSHEAQNKKLALINSQLYLFFLFFPSVGRTLRARRCAHNWTISNSMWQADDWNSVGMNYFRMVCCFAICMCANIRSSSSFSIPLKFIQANRLKSSRQIIRLYNFAQPKLIFSISLHTIFGFIYIYFPHLLSTETERVDAIRMNRSVALIIARCYRCSCYRR